MLLPALDASCKSMSPLDTILSFAQCPALPPIVRECGVTDEVLDRVCDAAGAAFHGRLSMLSWHGVNRTGVSVCLCVDVCVCVPACAWMRTCAVTRPGEAPCRVYRVNDDKVTAWLSGKVSAL